MDRCTGVCLDPNFSELFGLSLLRRLLEWLGIEEGDTGGHGGGRRTSPEKTVNSSATEKQRCPSDDFGGRQWRGPIARVGQGGVRCIPNQDGEARGWRTPWRGSGISPKYGKSNGAPMTYGGQGGEGRVEATLAQVLVEENTRGGKAMAATKCLLL
jgi:hypothetical protein